MRVCVVCYERLFGVLRENALCAHDIRYAGHYEKSLCSDNDLRCYSGEMKIISSDWIALLRRLLKYINNLRYSAIQSKEIIFILRMWQRGSLSEHNDSKSWRIDSKSWCHERQVRFLLKRETSASTAPRTRAFINLRDDLYAWTDRSSLTGIDKQWVQK